MPVSAAAATRNAADEGSPGTVPVKPSCWKRSSVTVDPSTSTGPPRAASARSVWSRVAAGSATARGAVGIESREQHRALHLGGRDRRRDGRCRAARPPTIATGAWPSVGLDGAPIARSGAATRSIGRLDRLGVAGEHRCGTVPPPATPASSRIEVPEFPQSSGPCGSDERRTPLTLDLKWRRRPVSATLDRSTWNRDPRRARIVRSPRLECRSSLGADRREARMPSSERRGKVEPRPERCARARSRRGSATDARSTCRPGHAASPSRRPPG